MGKTNWTEIAEKMDQDDQPVPIEYEGKRGSLNYMEPADNRSGWRGCITTTWHECQVDCADLTVVGVSGDYFESVRGIQANRWEGMRGSSRSPGYIEIHGQVGSGDPQMINDPIELEFFISRLREAAAEAFAP